MSEQTAQDRAQAAATLRALHVPGRPLVAPNAWDAASARAIESAGYPAVATSSAAVSACLGWPDGEGAPVEEMLTAAGRIARAVDVPVTVDFERGYRLAPEELVERFSRTGAVGLNLEDSDPATGALVDIDDQVRFIGGVRRAATAAGVDLVINARTDAFLRRVGTEGEQLAASIERGNRYLDAGADCVYPLGAGGESIPALVTQIDGPVNVARGPGSPYSIDDLAALGVARVTFGPGLQRQLYALLAEQILPSLAGAAR
ncbi:MAG: isocitrate lyase/phosphoenolpyruvate mutase family protein [Candidatus Dormibacteraeota bacterium]|nr:isocitrate lyase/phosphoenolpyruvate mutase family protein [Candidatus Dormibacteraeota bacterium]